MLRSYDSVENINLKSVAYFFFYSFWNITHKRFYEYLCPAAIVCQISEAVQTMVVIHVSESQ